MVVFGHERIRHFKGTLKGIPLLEIKFIVQHGRDGRVVDGC